MSGSRGPGSLQERAGEKAAPGRGRGQLWIYWIVGGGLWLWTISAMASGTTGLLPLGSYLLRGRETGQELTRVERRVSRLSRQVDALRSDPFSMERQAREREHRLRPGEILVLPGKDGGS